MQFRIRCALGAALSVAALAAGAPVAQAQPAVCSTRAFQMLDRVANNNPQAVAGLLDFVYRFARPQAAAGFDTLAQCDVTGAKAVYSAFQVLNASDAASFKSYFKSLPQYSAEAKSVFGGGIIIS
jgi:hypothetical protein